MTTGSPSPPLCRSACRTDASRAAPGATFHSAPTPSTPGPPPAQRLLSTSTTHAPAAEAERAAQIPAGPPPRTSTSASNSVIHPNIRAEFSGPQAFVTRSSPPLRPDQQSAGEKNHRRTGKRRDPPAAVGQSLRADHHDRHRDMPGHRFRAGAGKTTARADERGADHDEREQHRARGDRAAERPHRPHAAITGTPDAPATRRSNWAGSVVNAPRAIVLLVPW